MPYDDALHSIKPEFVVAGAGGAATTAYGKFRTFKNITLLRARAVVTVAGTNAGHGFDVYVGTASVATIPLGTAAADVVVDVTLNVACDSPAPVSFKSLVDATGKADLVLETRLQSDD